jgi:hypothetical protein
MKEDQLITLKEAGRILRVPYMQVLTDSRLKKVRVNRYYSVDEDRRQHLKKVTIESPGRTPMVNVGDLRAYQLEILGLVNKK